MEKPFEFTNDTWSDAQLRERGEFLGKNILFMAENSQRRTQVSREIGHIIFELSNRVIAEPTATGVQ